MTYHEIMLGVEVTKLLVVDPELSEVEARHDLQMTAYF